MLREIWNRSIMTSSVLCSVLCIAPWLFFLPAVDAALGEDSSPQKVLWQIGTQDGKPNEFALAPNRFSEFRADPIFVVGMSDPAKDWPYVQPGPSDAWAGSRQHEAIILFGLAKALASPCELVVDLVNTHSQHPPHLRVTCNESLVYDGTLPPGGPDPVISGDLSAAKPYTLRVPLAADALHAGVNKVVLASVAGSWIVFDAIVFLAPENLELSPISDVTLVRGITPQPALVRQGDQLKQVVELDILHTGEPANLVVQHDSQPVWSGQVQPGKQELIVPLDRVQESTAFALAVLKGDEVLWKGTIQLDPVREWKVYLLPHSHVDIGYTAVQTDVEKAHWRFFEEAMAAAEATADYPAEAGFKWNVEVLWAVDSYLRQASEAKRTQFIEAVRQGRIGLQTLYGNELTGLCRPEELLRLLDFAKRLEDRYDLSIDSAMISDVPGYTWGTITALAHGGVKYFSIGPNGGHRIGRTLQVWGDKVFWWKSPDGQRRVLCWIPQTGYWRGFRGKDELMGYLKRLNSSDYPLDLVQLRQCEGDNAGPATSISDFVKEWNEKYAFPKLIIATCSQVMHDVEERYGDKIPEVRGDLTGYWEDGAGSSAFETGLVRHAAERLSAAEALWAILQPAPYPDEAFYQAWRNVVLYDEHTWGAYNSISEPDSQFAKAQWAIKRQFALDADRQSQALLEQALAGFVQPASAGSRGSRYVMVFNPCGWARNDLVVVAPIEGKVVAVKDGAVKEVAFQRLSTGELAFLAKNVPGFGAKRYEIVTQSQGSEGMASRSGDTVAQTVATSRWELTVDTQTGAIQRLLDRKLRREIFSGAGAKPGAEYLYVPGRDPKQVQRVQGPMQSHVLDDGPLVKRLLVEGPAPGCRKLRYIYELVEGLDCVRVEMTVDKEKVRTPEAVHIAFPFAVPDGQLQLGLAWAAIRPDVDQLPGACKNYFTVQHWADVSNKDFGVTWVPLEAPLVELEKLRMDLPNPFIPDTWVAEIGPTQTIISYAMNNYWETNYKADQEGPTPFTYLIRTHEGGLVRADAARFGMSASRPLVAVMTGDQAPVEIPAWVTVEPKDVLPVELKTSRDGKAVILRLFNLGNKPAKVELKWTHPAKEVWLTDLSERPIQAFAEGVTLKPLEMVSLRIERAAQ